MSDLNLAIRLTTQGGKVVVKDMQQIESATQQVNHSLTGTGKSGSVAKQGFDKASTGADKLRRQSKEASTELQSMVKNAALMFSSYVSIAGAMRGINKADQFNVLTQRIETATKATGDFVQVNAELYDITQENRANLESTVEMFQRMSSARAELEATNAEMLKFTDAIQELGVIGGTSIINIKAGQTQLAQMLSGNIARAEEFNSILENTPEVAQRIAKGLGVSVGKLREMMLDGKLLSKDVFRAILSQTGQIHQDFNDIVVSIASAGQQADNALGKALSRLDELTGITDSIATTLVDIANTLDNMDANELQELAGTLAAMGGGIATLIFLKKLNVNLFTMAAASGTATKSIITKITALRTANSQLAFYANTSVKATAKITATTVATRALTIATRTLLGPIGLAITAGYMLYEAFAPDEIDKSTLATEKLAEAERKLAEEAKKAAQAKENKAPSSNINDHLQAAYEQQAMLIAQVDVMKRQQAAINQAYGETSVHAQTYSAQLKSNQNELSHIQRFIASILVGQQLLTAEQKKQAQHKIDKDTGGTKKLTQLQQQVALFGELSLAKQLDYQIEHGSLMGISEALAQQLRAETAKLTLLKQQQIERKKVKGNRTVIAELKKEVSLLKMSAKQKALFVNLSKLSANATQDEREAVTALTESLLEQQQAQKDNDYYDKIIKGASDIADNWNSAGNVIIDTFGSIGQQLDKLARQQQSYAEKQKKLAKDKLTYADDPNKIAKIEQAENALGKAKADNALSEIGSYRDITDSAASMFSENSKGRKAMEAASNVFTAIELGNSALRIGSYAIEAVTAAFSAPWPIGFASGAAMIAIMAGLGVAVSGGSGSAPMSSAERQETQSTGTVFGDSEAKSQSILNAYERIEDLELDQYAELQEMNRSLRDLNSNITHLATSLIGGYGKFDASSYGGELGSSNTGRLPGTGLLEKTLVEMDPTGIISGVIGSFSKTKKSLVDSGISMVGQTLGEIIESGLVNAQAYYDIKTKKSKFWGASSSTSYSTEYQALDNGLQHEFALIFGSVGDSITSAIDVLGIAVATETQSFTQQINSANPKFKNLETLDFDDSDFVGFFDGVIDNISEGATRSLENFKIELPNISFKELSGEEIEAELQAIFSHQADLMAEYLVPQIGEFQQVGEGLYDTLIRVAQEQAIFNHQMDAMGHRIKDVAGITAEAELAIAQSIIGLMGGLANFQAYTSTYFSEFFSDEAQFSFLEESLNDMFTGVGESLPATREGFKTLLKGIDQTTESGQALYAALFALVEPLDQYYDVLDDTVKKELALIEARKQFNDSFQAQLASMDMSPLEKALDELNQQFKSDFVNALELGADVQLLEAFYGKQRTVIIEQTLAEADNTFESAIDSIATKLNTLVEAIGDTREGLANSIRQIKRDMGGFDEVGFLNGNINNLYAQIGEGSIDEQISAVDALNDKILSRYEIEIGLSDERYQQELEQYNNLKSVLSDVGNYANGLSLSSYSPLSSAQRLTVSRNNFSSELSSAQNFDVDAIANISSSADAYLAEAQNMFGSSGQFTAIFNSVQSSLAQLSTMTPDMPDAVETYQAATLALQTSTISELQGLNAVLVDLETQATVKADSQTQLTTAHYNVQTDIIKQTSQLSEAQLEGQKLNNTLAKQQIEQQEKSNELSNQQLAEQQQMTGELIRQISQQSEMITVMQQQLAALKENNRNSQETNAQLVHAQRQA